jgi:hypothetical protein
VLESSCCRIHRYVAAPFLQVNDARVCIGLATLQYIWLYSKVKLFLCTFQISVDFYYVPVSGRGGAGEGEGARERGIELYCIGTVSVLSVSIQLVTHTVSVLTVPAIF